MKKPFFPTSIPGALGASDEGSFEANFDATNAVTDASCEPSCDPRPVRSESASEVNTLSTPGGNPRPPEALLCRSLLQALNAMLDQLTDANAPAELIAPLSHAFSEIYSWSQSQQQPL